MKVSKGWRYPDKGDYPKIGLSVLVYAADMRQWFKNGITRKNAEIGMYEQNATLKVLDLESGVEIWEGIPFHDVVVAWRPAVAGPDCMRVKNAIAGYQNGVINGSSDRLELAIASAFRYDPRKNQRIVEDLTRKFRQGVKDLGKGGLTGGNSTVKSAAFYDGKRLFTVEARYKHGVIVQIDASEGECASVARYAFDFPSPVRIYPSVADASRVLIAEGERQKWRRSA